MTVRNYPNIPFLSKYKTQKVLLVLPLVYACLLALGVMLSIFGENLRAVEPPKSFIGWGALFVANVFASIFASYLMLGSFYLSALLVRFILVKKPMMNFMKNALYFPVFYASWHVIPFWGSFSDRVFLERFARVILQGDVIFEKILSIAILFLMTAICFEVHLSILSHGGDSENFPHTNFFHRSFAYFFSVAGTLIFTQMYLSWR